jgi:carbon storage regulator
MLVLSRKIGQKLTVGGNITIQVVDVVRGVVRLGVEAPREIIVDREEVHHARRREKRTEDLTRGHDAAITKGDD